MYYEAFDKFRFSRGQKLTVGRLKTGLLILKACKFAPYIAISRSKKALKHAVFSPPYGQLLDTLLIYQVVTPAKGFPYA